MTEEEAKEKWCPLIGSSDRAEVCIASMCMAWVWDVHPDHLNHLNPEAKGHCGMVK